MKRSLVLTMVWLSALVLPLLTAHEVEGTWQAKLETPRGTRELTFTFKVEGDKLTGTIKSPRRSSDIENGKIQGDTLSFDQKMSFGGRSMTFHYTGKLTGDEIHFTREAEGRGRKSEFTAKRKQ